VSLRQTVFTALSISCQSFTLIYRYQKWCIGSACGYSDKRPYHNPRTSVVLKQMLWAEIKTPTTFQMFPFVHYILLYIHTTAYLKLLTYNLETLSQKLWENLLIYFLKCARLNLLPMAVKINAGYKVHKYKILPSILQTVSLEGHYLNNKEHTT
jgi:hypothetical protein